MEDERSAFGGFIAPRLISHTRPPSQGHLGHLEKVQELPLIGALKPHHLTAFSFQALLAWKDLRMMPIIPLRGLRRDAHPLSLEPGQRLRLGVEQSIRVDMA